MTRDSGKTEAGFTIVEVLVAVLILVIGALTTFGLLSAATRNTERAKATQVAQDMAQQEIEALRSYGSEELALIKGPPHSNDPLDPNYRVNVTNRTFAVDREPVGDYQKLVVNDGPIEGVGTSEEGTLIKGGVISPGPTSFKNGDVTGEIYRYIVWRNDDACGEACPTQQDYKQIIVAVKLDTPGNQAGKRGYVEIQSSFVDPVDSEKNDPTPDSEGNVVTAQQFFLSDTSCSADGETERADIIGDHSLHNTLGTCASGQTEAEIPGAPDALLLGGPPDPAPEDPSNPPLYDYAGDLEPTPDTDKGIQIPKQDATGCNYDQPPGTTNPQLKMHRWVTDPMAADFTMTEKVTLEFYTRTLNDELYKASLCVYLYVRHEEGSPPVATDTSLFNKVGGTPYWIYTPEKGDYWPRFEWKKVRLTMALNEAHYTIAAGDRLVVGLSVERSVTEREAISIMYDHPNYPTRIEVDTSTPIEGG